MRAKRLLPVMCTDKLPEIRDFYSKLLDLSVIYESQGYAYLASSPGPGGESVVEIGIERRETPARAGETIPPVRKGIYLSVEVDDLDAVHARAQSMKAEILEKPVREEYDRRRLLLRDPDGMEVEIFTSSDPREAMNSEYMEDQ